jgi:hypothetical protein
VGPLEVDDDDWDALEPLRPPPSFVPLPAKAVKFYREVNERNRKIQMKQRQCFIEATKF